MKLYYLLSFIIIYYLLLFIIIYYLLSITKLYYLLLNYTTLKLCNQK